MTDISQPLQNGFPWGSRTAARTNPYEDSPNTGTKLCVLACFSVDVANNAADTNAAGVFRNYDFTLKRGFIAPDGVNKSVILINGQFPGVSREMVSILQRLLTAVQPTLEANWGDMFQITVHNQITGPEEGTALHWHGAQYAAGLFGPMIIHGPHEDLFYDKDLGPILLSDWYHTEYFKLVEQVVGPPGPPPFSDNNLINGKMDYDCSLIPNGGPACTPNAGISKFSFTSGKTHRLRLINSGSEALQRFSIDGHEMLVIANDFVPVVPYKTNVVTLGIGQRTDVLVKATMPANSAVFMRSNITQHCSTANQPNAVAAIYYEKADQTKTPKSTATVFDDSKCGNDDLKKTRPLFPFPALQNAATTQNIDITFGPNATNHNLWYMNKQTFRANYDHPVFLLAAAGNTSYPYDPQWNVYNFGSNASVRLIVKNNFPALHPMHLHGHNFFVLAEGTGTWDGRITNYPFTNRRDVQMVQPNGYLVLQYDTDNPGVWPFHCHIAWHVSGGLYVNLMEQPEGIKKRNVPQIMAQTCRDWSEYSGHNVVEQIDSGL
ncbi:hypothetical protein Q9189_006582 [Teloschistes chrysophthalmus]